MMDESATTRPAGNGNMAALIRSFDWGATPLGPAAAWPVPLAGAAAMMLAATSPVAVYWGPDLILLYNDAWRALVGDRYPDLLGQPARIAFAAAWERLSPLFKAVLDGHGSRRAEDVPVAAGGGAEKWFTFSLEPVPLQEAGIGGILSVAIDTTESVCAKEAMRDSEERYRSLFQAMDQGYALFELVRDDTGDVTDCRFIEVNAAIECYAGQSADTLAGRLRSEILPGSSNQLLAAAGRVVATGMPIRIEDLNEERGRWFDIGLYARSADRFVGLFTDVTDRKRQDRHLREHEARHRAELEREVRDRTAELKQSRDLLQATMDSSVDMIQVFEAIRDASGEIVDFRWLLNNHTSESRYGSVEGESLLQRNPGVVIEGIFDAFRRVTETGIPEQAERHYKHEQFDGWFYQSVVKLGDGVATTTKDISAWKATQQEVLRLRDEIAAAQLRQSEERLKQFGEASQDVLWIRDADTLQWQYVTPAFETICGISRQEAQAGDNFRCWLDLILPEDRSEALESVERVRRGEQVSFEYRIRRPSDGAIRWLKDTDFPIHGPDGDIRFIGGIGTDVTETRLTQERLEQSEERLRSAVEVGKLGLWDWNVKTGEINWSDEHYRLEGYAVGEVVPSYDAWAARIFADDRSQTEAALKEAMEQREDYVREFRVLHPDGSVHWLYGRGRFFYDAAEQPVRMVGAMIDVTDRKEWEDRLQVLVLELQHRTRNLLGVVRSLANSTLRSSGSLSEFRATFQDRLAALARVNGLLSRLNEGDRIRLEELLAAELLALGVSDAYGERITLNGPRGVRLRSGTVQTFALALHELATNAVKYGAFATPEGSLSIRWELSRQDGRTHLNLEWKERGVRMPATDSGFPSSGYGRELIERALPYQLKAKTTYVLEEDGVHCKIMMPISET